MLSGKQKALILLMILAFVGLSFILLAQAYREGIKSDIILSAEITYTDGTSRTVDEVISLSIYDPAVGKQVDHITLSLILVPNWDTEDPNAIFLGGTISFVYQSQTGETVEILPDGVFSESKVLTVDKKQSRIIIKQLILSENDLNAFYEKAGSIFVFRLQAEVSMQWGISSTYAFIEANLRLDFDLEEFTIFSAFASPSIPYLSVQYPQTFQAQAHNTFKTVADNGYWLVPMFVIMFGVFGVMTIRFKKR